MSAIRCKCPRCRTGVRCQLAKIGKGAESTCTCQASSSTGSMTIDTGDPGAHRYEGRNRVVIRRDETAGAA
jgi:hypothetical protein